MNKIRVIFLNGFISSLTGIIMSLTGVWLNIYITNRAGAETMGNFQLIMSVCSFAVTFAVSGISFAAMRLVAEGIGERKNADSGKIMAKCFSYAAFFGGLGFVLLFLLSDFISCKFLDYPTASACLKAFSLTLPAAAVLSAISGYFTAVRRGFKDSAVRIFSQLLRLVLTALFLYVGQGDPCLTIMAAAVVAELLGAVLSILLYITDHRKHRYGGKASCGKILPIGLPIAFSTYLRSGIMTVKNLFVPTGLVKYGLTPSAAAAAFGLVHGIALPVILFPSTFLFSFSALAVPELARVYSGCDNLFESKRITYMINRSIQLTMLFSIAAAGIIFFFAEPLCMLVTKNTETIQYIKILAPVIPIMYLDNTVDNMLKGLNEQVSSMKFNIIDSTISLLLVIFLLPKSGIYGYIFIIILGEVLNFIMSIHRLKKIASVKLELTSHVVLPILSITASSLVVKLVFPHSPVIINSILCILLYCLLTSLTGSFSKEDRKWLRNAL